MTFSKIKAKETRKLTRTLEKTLEAKLACSDTTVVDNTKQWYRQVRKREMGRILER